MAALGLAVAASGYHHRDTIHNATVAAQGRVSQFAKDQGKAVTQFVKAKGKALQEHYNLFQANGEVGRCVADSSEVEMWEPLPENIDLDELARNHATQENEFVKDHSSVQGWEDTGTLLKNPTTTNKDYLREWGNGKKISPKDMPADVQRAIVHAIVGSALVGLAAKGKVALDAASRLGPAITKIERHIDTLEEVGKNEYYLGPTESCMGALKVVREHDVRILQKRKAAMEQYLDTTREGFDFNKYKPPNIPGLVRQFSSMEDLKTLMTEMGDEGVIEFFGTNKSDVYTQLIEAITKINDYSQISFFGGDARPVSYTHLTLPTKA